MAAAIASTRSPDTAALSAAGGRALRRDLVWVTLLGLACLALAATAIDRPGYPDAYYYFGGGVQLARGNGFTEPYVWTYLAPPVATGADRWASHLYWQPLASLWAAPWLAAAEAAGGPLPYPALFRVAQAAFLLPAAVLALLSYIVSQWWTGSRRHAWAAAGLTLFSPFYFVYWANTETFALHALAAAGGLAAAGRALQLLAAGRRATGWWLLAGLAAGLAHLARADGVLVLGVAALGWIAAGRGAGGRGLVALVAGYALVMAPWLARSWLLTGWALPVAGARTMWLAEYNEFFTYSSEQLTAARFLDQGWQPMLAGKLAALQANALTLLAAPGSILALPLALGGGWALRRHPAFRLALLYAVALYALMSLVFTFPGARGGFFHSAAALAPFVYPAAVLGLDRLVETVARRLPRWQPRRSQPVFTLMLVGLAAGLSALVLWQRVLGSAWPSASAWSQHDRAYVAAGTWLAQAGHAADRVAANNPPAWHYFTQATSIVIPNGDVGTLLEAMQAYQARWVVLDANYPAGLAELYAAPGRERRLRLRATFADEAGRPVYLLERVDDP